MEEMKEEVILCSPCLPIKHVISLQINHITHSNNNDYLASSVSEDVFLITVTHFRCDVDDIGSFIYPSNDHIFQLGAKTRKDN